MFVLIFFTFVRKEILVSSHSKPLQFPGTVEGNTDGCKTQTQTCSSDKLSSGPDHSTTAAGGGDSMDIPAPPQRVPSGSGSTQTSGETQVGGQVAAESDGEIMIIIVYMCECVCVSE